ncbi:MAG: polysaccharide deacetylase family protein [Rhodobacteraceae bacterium]|nr:polysaccharide deacetylase family protein [Paracoccaceae bacterium]
MTDDAETHRRSLSRRVARRVTGMVRVAPLRRMEAGFHLSIALDDCPDSACTRGVEVLDAHGLRATFYIATGLLGQDGVSGPITTAQRIRALAAEGHEIALHTHDHADLTGLSVADALADIQHNISYLQDILGANPSPHFAYPYGETTLTLKRALLGHVASARGVRAGINRIFADRMQLFACDLGSHRPDYLAAARRLMQSASISGGWVVLFTHDVQPNPSPYGVTPQVLDSLVKEAIALGATPAPIGETWSRLSAE